MAKRSTTSFSKQSMIQNFDLVYLDETNGICHDSATRLRQIVNTVYSFADVDQCMDFITDRSEETTFMIVSESLIRNLVPVVENIHQIKCVYIFHPHKTLVRGWDKKCSKIRGVFTDIERICEALQKDSKDYEHNAVSISFAKSNGEASNTNRNGLNCSFMYTQILKDILLTIKFDNGHILDFLNYCNANVAENDKQQLKKLEKFRMEYRSDQAIWWYTAEKLLYSMINRALRVMDIDVILKMGFFLCDLHNHIQTLHSEQFAGERRTDSFVVYRGQGLTTTDFNQLKMNQGGLLAFNSFLSASYDRQVSTLYAESNATNPNLKGVLFEIVVDPSISVASFANIKGISHFQEEDEILFSMHSVFRIGQIKELINDPRIWEVQLTLTSDNDPDLSELTENMNEEISYNANGWIRLGGLLIRLQKFDKAAELYELLLTQTNDKSEQLSLYHYLGWIHCFQRRYIEAIKCYEKSIKIENNNSPNSSDFITLYNDMRLLHKDIGPYTRAFDSYEKALAIRQRTISVDHPPLAASYNGIAMVHYQMGRFSKALEYYEKSLQIEKNTLPENHPDFADAYNNIGLVYYRMGEYSKALEYNEKSLEICQKSLPASHPDLATLYSNIGSMYHNGSKYSRALEYYEKALEISKKTLPENHPNLATTYNNIGSVYDNMNEYSKALAYYEKSLQIEQTTLPENHPDLATSYNNIAVVYHYMGDCSKALEYNEKSLQICQKSLPTNHPDLAISYSNIGLMYHSANKYSRALEYYEKALEISKNALPENHPNLATAYNNIGNLYGNMNEYSKALAYYEKSLQIEQTTLPENHPDLATSYNNIAVVYHYTGDCSRALEYYEKSLEISKSILHQNHPGLAASYSNIGSVYYSKKDYKMALKYFKHALDILQSSPPVNYAYIKVVTENIRKVRKDSQSKFFTYLIKPLKKFSHDIKKLM